MLHRDSTRARTILSVVALTCCLAASSLGAAAQAAGAETQDKAESEARTLVAQGEALFRNGDYTGALHAYTRALRLLEATSRKHLVLYNLGVCYERLYQYARALEYYQEYLRCAPADASDRDQVQAVVRTLDGLLGSLRVTANVPAEVWIDTNFGGTTPLSTRVPGGRHLLELRAANHEALRREIEINAREPRVLQFELTPLSTVHGAHPAFFWTSVGLSAAALTTGLVFGASAVAEDRSGNAAAARFERIRGPELESSQDRARRLAISADVAFGTAALFAASSIVLFFVTDWSSSDAKPRDAGLASRALGQRAAQ